MLDVHPPHEKIESFKDFLLHLFTITIGLFIALALEGCVERVHQHHLRDEADGNLRQELRDNARAVGMTRKAIATEKQNLIKAMQFLEARMVNKPYDIAGIGIGFSSGTLSDASWRTATATGALSYMEYPKVQKFAAAYQSQDVFTRLEEQTLDQFLQLQSYVAYGFDPKTMSAEDAKAAMGDTRRALSELEALDEIGGELQQTYDKALAGK